MKQENKSYARTLNRRLKAWDKEGMESNLLKEVREDLEMFYDKYDIEANEDYFSANLDLTTEEEAEYEKIMDKFGNKAGSNINEMKRKYEEVKDDYETNYNVKTFEDFIDFTDQMKIYESDALLRDIISSEQVSELYSKSSKKGMSYEKVDDLILKTYEGKDKKGKKIAGAGGLTYNNLYNKVLDIISKEKKK